MATKNATYPVTAKFERELMVSLSQAYLPIIDEKIVKAAVEYIGENEHDTPEGIDIRVLAEHIFDFLLYYHGAQDE